MYTRIVRDLHVYMYKSYVCYLPVALRKIIFLWSSLTEVQIYSKYMLVPRLQP